MPTQTEPPDDVRSQVAIPSSRRPIEQETISPASAHSRAVDETAVEECTLLIGYLSAVALRLNERGILARSLHTEPSPLAGVLTLDVTPHNGSVWIPTLLRWAWDEGWSATLCRQDEAQRHARAVRYLPSHQLLPAPESVAHFVAALRSDPNTTWGAITLHPHEPLDRRVLAMRLGAYSNI